MTIQADLFYTLAEVSERWGKTENEVLQLAVHYKFYHDLVIFFRECIIWPAHSDPVKDEIAVEVDAYMHIISKSLFIGLMVAGDKAIQVNRELFTKCNPHILPELIMDRPGRYRPGDPLFLAMDLKRVDDHIVEEETCIQRGELLFPGKLVIRLEKTYSELNGVSAPAVLLNTGGNKKHQQTNGAMSAAHEKGPGGHPTYPFSEAIKEAYLYFRKKGNTDILQPNRPRDFVKSLMTLVKNENWDEKGNEKENVNISAYISQRIKGQKTKNRYTYIETQEYIPETGKNKGKPMPVRRYPISDVSKQLCMLRNKYHLSA